MWYNPIIAWILRSPLHGILSKSMLLLSYTGRKSGRQYSTPVNYIRLQDEQGAYLLTTSLQSRSWWRNLRGGAPVSVHLQGRLRQAHSVVFEEPSQVAAYLHALYQAAPQYARYHQVKVDAGGTVSAEAVEQVAQGKIIIRTTLD